MPLRFVALLASLALVACAPAHLDVGTRVVDDDAGATAPSDASTKSTPLATLDTAACSLAEGARDSYASPAALVARVTGRWVLCPTNAPPFADPVDGIEFGTSGGVGTYVVLERKGDTLMKRTDVRGFGTYKVWAYSDPDLHADAGGTFPPPGFVSLDETGTRGSMLLYLFASDGTADVIVSLDFETGPRRMFVSEVGGVDVASGTFMSLP